MPKHTQCPIDGCRKRSTRAGLIDHARQKHPDTPAKVYLQLLDPPKLARREAAATRSVGRMVWISLAAGALVALGVGIALAYIISRS